MAKYKKRPDGRYATSTIIGYTDDGRPKRKTIYGRTIAELDRKVADFKSLQNKGIVIDDKNYTLGEWAQRWLELYKSDKEYNTYIMYKRTIDNHIIPALGSIRLGVLKTHNIQGLINSILQAGHHRTAELVRLTMSQIIKQAIKEEYIYKDVTVGLSLPKAPKPQKRALTAEEIGYIQNADLTPKERVFLDLIYYTGIRRGEALALMVGDIDLKNKNLKINKNLVLKNGDSQLKPSPKSDAGNRIIPIPDNLIKSLKYYFNGIGTLYLFTQQDGKPMSQSSFRRFWDNIINKINIAAGGTKIKGISRSDNPIRVISKDITPHMFRHTYATNLYYAGIDIKTAQYLLGHASVQMTMDIYTHLDNSRISTAGNALNTFFSDKNKMSDSQNIVSGEN